MWDNFIGTTSSVMVRKDTLLAVNKFDEKLPALQDYDLYIRICKKYKVTGIDRPLIKYLNNHSINQISKNKNHFQQACKLLELKYKTWPHSSMLMISLSKLKIKRKFKEFYE